MREMIRVTLRELFPSQLSHLLYLLQLLINIQKGSGATYEAVEVVEQTENNITVTSVKQRLHAV